MMEKQLNGIREQTQGGGGRYRESLLSYTQTVRSGGADTLDAEHTSRQRSVTVETRPPNILTHVASAPRVIERISVDRLILQHPAQSFHSWLRCESWYVGKILTK